MFLKKLKIENDGSPIREILFHKGFNLIVDETETKDKKESGNNVGKTTVLRLIDYCFGSDGKNIYKDTEFKGTGNTQIEHFLKDNNIIVTLILTEDIDDGTTSDITIRRNFLKRQNKIQEINGKSYNNNDGFCRELKRVIFKSSGKKPTFRQIISKNIRYEKNRLLKTINVLHDSTPPEAYEALYLFWLGIDLEDSDRKLQLTAQRKVEEHLQKRLRKESTPSQIKQSLLVISRTIEELTKKKDSFNLNQGYEEDLAILNQVKFEIERLSTTLSRLELRRELINESKIDLENELSEIDSLHVKSLYEEARVLIPNIQKSFEDTLAFHNQMVAEKIKYITKELPVLDIEIKKTKREFRSLLNRESVLTKSLSKTEVVKELQQIITELNQAYEKKGNLEELQRLWEKSQNS